MTTPTPRHSLLVSVFLLTVTVFGVPSAHAQQPMSLDDCIAYALEHSAEVVNAGFDQYIARARIKEVAATGLPRVNLTADLQYFVELPTQILPGFFAPQQDIVFIDGKPYPLTRLDPETNMPIPGDEINAQFGFPWQSTVGANASWSIFDAGYLYGLKGAKEYASLTQRQGNRTREETAFTVAQAYFQAVVTQEQEGLLIVNQDRVASLLADTKALNEAGFVESIDVDRLQISLNNLTLEREKIQRLARLSIALLQFQMGMPLEIPLSIDKPDLLARESWEQQIEPVPAFDPSLDADLAILQKTEDLQQLDLKRTQAGYLPTLSVFGNYQFNAQRNEFNIFSPGQDWFPISVVGVQMNWNIFDSFMKVRQVQQQRLELDKLGVQRIQLTQGAQLEYEQAKTNLLDAQGSLRASKANVELAERVFQVSSIKYQEGVGSSLEVNEASTELLRAENAYLAAWYQYLQANLSLDKASGSFSQYHSFR